MSAPRVRFAGLGTRVAARTFALFCICAVVPIVISAVMADRVVRTKMQADAASHLASTSKSYGLLVFERLRQTDESLAELATLALNDGLALDDVRAFRSSHFKVVDILSDPPAGTRQVALSLRGTDVRLTVVAENATRRLQVTAQLEPSYLWDADAVYLDAMRICVHGPTGTVLQCVDDGAASDQPTADRSLTGEWSLFLAPRYGAEAWAVRTAQPESVALSALDSFERTLPLVTLVGIVTALLLSTVQIRRSHRPLTLLTDAVERMGRRGLHRRVTVDTNDEYEHLAQAFNRMASGLARQFELFRTLARIDRMILDDPSTEVLVEKILPTLPRLLHAKVIAVAVAARSTGKVAIWWSSADGATVSHLQTDALTVDMLIGKTDVRIPALSDAQSSLQALFGLPIEVDNNLRGALLLADPDTRGSSMRHARAFARRFAVALGSEERRESLLKQAYYDDLTGLPNRQLFKDRLEREITHAKRSQTQVALIYIDLDRFKNVNDSMGHSAGDALLLAVSQRLASQVRESDTLARLGGDEFVLIAPGPDEHPAHVLAERLQAALRDPIIVQDATCFVQASIGLAIYPQDGADAEALLRSSDIAMYRAKVAGRGSVMYFEEAMNRDAQRRLLIEQRLRVALRNRSLTLTYQAKVDLNDGSLAGVEALARWTDEQLGAVPPKEFIAVAEECGLIDELGTWVLHEACATYQELRQRGIELGHVSVNASMRQLQDARFVAEVRDTLARLGMSPHALDIEVTESTLADNPGRVNELLEALRKMGVRISIDDFGTGYSSMSALGVLPTDALKIDRSFVIECASQRTARSVVEAIISIAHVLGKVTVAEGVETLAQVQTLRELGCDFAQGYLFAKPACAADLPAVAARATVWRDVVVGSSASGASVFARQP